MPKEQVRADGTTRGKTAALPAHFSARGAAVKARTSSALEDRTPVTGVRGRCLNRLTNGPSQLRSNRLRHHLKVLKTLILLCQMWPSLRLATSILIGILGVLFAPVTDLVLALCPLLFPQHPRGCLCRQYHPFHHHLYCLSPPLKGLFCIILRDNNRHCAPSGFQKYRFAGHPCRWGSQFVSIIRNIGYFD